MNQNEKEPLCNTSVVGFPIRRFLTRQYTGCQKEMEFLYLYRTGLWRSLYAIGFADCENTLTVWNNRNPVRIKIIF